MLVEGMCIASVNTSVEGGPDHSLDGGDVPHNFRADLKNSALHETKNPPFPPFSIRTALLRSCLISLHEGFIYKRAFTLLSTYYVLPALCT